MLTFGKFKLPKNFQDDEAFKNVKIRFHVVLGKKEEEVWSLKKISRLITI